MIRLAGALSLLATAALTTSAAAELYQWTDGAGVRHYTSDSTTIPEAYREGARDMGSPRVREVPAGESRRGADAGVMRFTSGAPVVAAVLVNGVAMRLIVDTGADRTVISPAAAARTGLAVDAGRSLRVVGVTGGTTANETVVTHMDVAGARVGPLRVIVLDTPSDSFDGLLGRDVLDFFTLTVDSRAGRATLTPR
ncbi:MAG TPA: retropepsin-like aspartic protease [Candidatus Acidoferrum sp.]|nr:retropepsin-like aspartic protease [Candidatus Acidoferrum sp.]